MIERLISFETAKLAKDKGFDIPCELMYLEDTGAITYISAWDKELYPDYFDCGLIFIPTQTLIQKWLREKYKLNANTRIYKKDVWHPVIQDLKILEQKGFINEVFLPINFGEFKNHEDGLEESLYKSLLLI